MNSTFNKPHPWQALLLAGLMMFYFGVVRAEVLETFPETFPEIFPDLQKGELLYSNPLAEPADVATWIMEGPGTVSFANGWMTMYAPNEKMHHVFWCPENFPASFVAEWEAQNLHT